MKQIVFHTKLPTIRWTHHKVQDDLSFIQHKNLTPVVLWPAADASQMTWTRLIMFVKTNYNLESSENSNVWDAYYFKDFMLDE